MEILYQIKPIVKKRPRVFLNKKKLNLSYDETFNFCDFYSSMKDKKSFNAMTPKYTKNYEDIIKYHTLFFMNKNSIKITDLPLKIEIDFIFKKNKNKYPIKLPYGDIDNYLKSILDAWNNVIYYDDRQIVEITCRKKFGETDSILAKIEYME